MEIWDPLNSLHGSPAAISLSASCPRGLLHDIAGDIAGRLECPEAEVELDLRRIVYGWRTIHHVSTTPGSRRKNKGHMFTGWYFQVT